ncbi:hypothetical protein TTHERM_00189160 (macronuclear) [Tetrahymena thermophila SB210]|uniref:Uncharacterized protein n=1 Tax=Tetrahymena thermophila (strain SB210) TaxID=312017 RepID=I7M1H3_TETTS|nr:hypothetical protein TTHERM_00189160 [Tetrahymena thermophila SB210]EAR96347.2 hypothetical protein TTHERM_00189160 [Tetrahymena thermophila SB210]|eukprot:XP_001016592.2 hypothetical protein TTHERM_00189160 [Tetrahymena thermophila SB210]
MRTQVVNLWNFNNVQTADKEAQIKYAYSKHQQQLKQLNSSKKTTFDTEAPYQKKKRNVAYSKPNKERQFIIEQENGALIHKMIDVKKKDGEYSKKLLIKSIQSSTAPKSLFLPLKQATEKKVNSENIAMTMRLRNANSTINFKTFDKDFAQNIKYKSNITNRSRRIYNCFLLNGSQTSMLGKSSLSSSLYQQTGNIRHVSQDDKSKFINAYNLVDSPPKQNKKSKKQEQNEPNQHAEQQPIQDKKQENQSQEDQIEEQIVQNQQPSNDQNTNQQDQQKQNEGGQNNNQTSEQQQK